MLKDETIFFFKKNQSQPMLTLKICDHGHKIMTAIVEGKLKKPKRKILKKIRHETIIFFKKK